MARVVKEDVYTAKRTEILETALRLIYSKGYEQMAIQDILDALQISRGAFYHYFVSKQALLDALVDRMGRGAEELILPIVQDPQLTAIEKFRRYFEVSAGWKTVQKPLIVSLLRMWYSEENAVIRQKMNSESIQHTARFLEPIIHQGIEEKVFTTRYPAQAAVIIAGVALSLSDSIVGLLTSSDAALESSQKYMAIVGAYVDAIERILGAPTGSLKIPDPDPFEAWVTALQPE